jgi:DNA-binding MarR family transcriptional regulator
MTRGTAEPVDCAVTVSEYQMLARFRRALRVFLHFSELAARAAGLTPAQHQLLLAVKGAESDQPPTIGEMATSLQLRHHSAVGLVDRAASAGLIARVADPDDGRRQRLVLTTLGETKLASLSEVLRDEVVRFKAEMLGQLEELPLTFPAGDGLYER